MEEKELLQQIAILAQKRYNGLNEIENVTNQLQDALHYNDVVTIRMLIRMRQQAMDEIDHFDRQRKELMEQLTPEQREELKHGEPQHFAEGGAFVQKIAEIQQKSQALLKRLIAQDERVNRKLAGDKSYYNQ